MECTIYDKGIWERILEKRNLKELAMEMGVYENPEKAKEMMKEFRHNFGIGKLSKKERDFCTELLSAKFVEQDLLHMLVVTGNEHYSAGANDYVVPTMNLVLVDFNNSFEDFIHEWEKRGMKIETMKFSEAYEIFLDVIKLKLKYQVPYTKLFIRKLLEFSPDCFKKEDSLEIKQYFLEKYPDLLPELKEVLLID